LKHYVSMISPTHFAPAQRSSPEQIMEDKGLVISQKFLTELFGGIDGVTAIINKNRQIIFANNDFLKMLGFNSLELILGKRPGEVISCVNSNAEPAGCGTSEACAYCGAVNAILVSQRTGQKSGQETRISSIIDGKIKSWDLFVKSTPVKIKDQDFYILSLEDKSNEKRRLALEKIFFHDILNTAGGLNGLLQLLKEGTDPEEARELINLSERASKRLIEEIMLQRQLRSAENGDLEVKIEKIGAIDALTSSIEKVKFHEVAKGKNIEINTDLIDTELETDSTLLQRILINLIKNAYEATSTKSTVSAGIHDGYEYVTFWVKNDLVMPKEIQMQVFQRSYSTKGTGRGIGTYSVRLLTENYLRGKVGFVSNEEEGTIFSVELNKKFPLD
jgi:K+-sensing histidine kinase KdpD